MDPSASAPPRVGPAPALGAIDALFACALAVGLAALYALTFQERQFGDGSPITRDFLDTLESGGVWTHALYFPAARVLWRLLEPANPVNGLKLVSLMGGACGGAAVYLLARAFDTDRFRALVAALLLAVSPAWWFFATTIEVLGLHLFCVALCALLVLLAPWQRPVLATCLAALALPLVFQSHKSGLFLGPGFVALSQVGRLRRGLPPLSWRALLLGVGPVFLASFVFAAWLSARMLGHRLSDLVRESSGFVAGYHALGEGFVFVSLWGLPLGAVGPLALAALALRRTRGWQALAVAAWSALPLVFFCAWGVSERGGYALSTAVLLVVAAVSAFDGRSRAGRAAWIALVAAQAALGLHELRSWDAPEWGRDNRARALAVERAIGPRGTLVSLNLRFQEIEADLPGMREINLYPLLRDCVDEQVEGERFAAEVVELVRAARAAGPVALEFSFEANFAGRPEATYLEALHREVEREYSLRSVPDPRWPLFVVSAAAGHER